jgi:hypothetical protein
MSAVKQIVKFRTEDGQEFESFPQATYHNARLEVLLLLKNRPDTDDDCVLNTLGRNSETIKAVREWLSQVEKMYAQMKR